MATFTVYFAGLMIHVGEDADVQGIEKKHVALIDAPEHKPVVRISKDDLEGPYAEDFEHKLKKGDEVTFNLKPGVATTNKAFRTALPKLSSVAKNGASKADLDVPVKLRKPHGDIVAYVHYPAGGLGVYSYFKNRAKYILNAVPIEERCVAYVTQFTGETEYPVTVTIWRERQAPVTVTVKAAGKVCILNEDDQSPTPGHFGNYKSALEASDIAVVEKTGNCELYDAEKGNRAPCHGTGVAPHPECSNSTWP